MSMELNPNQVKRREHLGISTMMSGALFILGGLITLFISWAAAAGAILLGVLALLTGGTVLARIPDLLNSPEHAPEHN